MDWTKIVDEIKVPLRKNRLAKEWICDKYRPMLGAWLIDMALYFDWVKSGTRLRRRFSKRTNSYRTMIPDWVMEDEEFLSLTGIPSIEELEKGGVRVNARSISTLFRRRRAVLSRQAPPKDAALFRNIEALGEMLSLGEVDRAIVALAASFRLFRSFRSVIESRSQGVDRQELPEFLSRLLGFPETAIRESLSDDGPLVSAGLLRIDTGDTEVAETLVLVDGLSPLLLQPEFTIDHVLGRYLRCAPTPKFTTADYPHISGDTHVLRKYLSRAVGGDLTGVNILVHGMPGVGKTEYVRALAAETGRDLYEIASSDEAGDPLDGKERLQALRFCQCLLGKSPNALLLLDEIEDVFPKDNGFIADLRFEVGKGSKARAGKAWINKLLEGNAVPSIWIGNRVEHIDPAYLRRFDYSIRFPVPPTSVRLEIARHHFSGMLLPDGWLEKIAADEELTPAQLERAVKIAAAVASGGGEEAGKVAERVIDRSAALLEQRRVAVRPSSATRFDLAFVNADADIQAILNGLTRRPKGTLCFHGEPGTGKTELARYIADRIGKPILVRRASDIFSMWVGGTEKNIARMFREAKEKDAVLQLDEADSFLRDRRGAVRSWEVSFVNELLTQMEAFEGVFICTTNLMDSLDAASLRRFALKIRFRPLTSDQRWAMFRIELARLGGPEVMSDPSMETRVRSLDGLTPGDFAVASRQFALLNVAATADSLYDRLLAEVGQKRQGSVGRIGFG